MGKTMRLRFLLALAWLSLSLTIGQADSLSPAPRANIGPSADSLPESPFASRPSLSETPEFASPAKPQGIQRLIADWRDLESRWSMPLEGPRFWLADRFDRLAWDAGQAAMAFHWPTEPLAARELAIQSLARRALLAARLGDEPATQIRLAQVQLAASVLAQTKLPSAREIALRWQRWFDFQQAIRGKAGWEARSAAALVWLSKMADDSHPAEQLALLALADHLGRSDLLLEPCRRIQADGDQVAPSVRQFVQQRLAHRYLLGRSFTADLRLADHRRWSVGQVAKEAGKNQGIGKAGRVGEVEGKTDGETDGETGGGIGGEIGGGGGWRLIHFYADWHRPSMDQAAAIARYRQEIGPDRLSVLSVALWPDPLSSAMTASAAPPKADWPVYQESSSQVSLSKLFYVTQLPRLVLIDPQGRIVSISGSLSPLTALLGSSPPMTPVPLEPSGG